VKVPRNILIKTADGFAGAFNRQSKRMIWKKLTLKNLA